MSDPNKNLLLNAQSLIVSLEERVKELEEQLGKVGIQLPVESQNAEAAGREKTRLTKSTGKQISDNEGKIGGHFELTENPAFLSSRLAFFDELYKKKQEEISKKPKDEIKVTLPDGTIVVGKAWETSPWDIAMKISEGLAKASIVAKVQYTDRFSQTERLGGQMEEFSDEAADLESGGELWDMPRPLEGDCKLQLLKFDDPEAKMVFWHSSAHVLGQCLERKLGGHLTVGPPVQNGFYYDTYIGEHGIDDKKLSDLQSFGEKIAKEKQQFQRLVLSKEEALTMFAYNPYKQSIIKNKVKDGEKTCVYRNGPFVDLCMGPHIHDTGSIRAIELKQATTSFWLGNDANDRLQRVHGIAFPDKKELKEYKDLLKKAEENDHRKRGLEQDLFFFDPLSPGCAFWKPHGAIIFNKLMNWIKEENRANGYKEVVTPNVYSVDLWKKSGHWEHYQKNMFTFTDGEASNHLFALKPMNCPGHCVIFDSSTRSHRDLPLRLSDFGVLHRNEASGALSGLTRVRRFQQDDAHLFVRRDQVEAEVLGALNMVRKVYQTLGLKMKVGRSTRPKKAIGLVNENGERDEEGVRMWDEAEEQLATALDTFVGKGNWKDNPGDGAFYGPKIDIEVFDALKRKHQCATIQLDFQMPKRFNLKFSSDQNETGASNLERPVMIHRAVLGSIERMTAILTEHFGGKWPFWLSPRQVMIIPVAAALNDYAMKLKDTFFKAGFEVEVDLSTKTLNKKIRLAQVEQFNFMLIVGAQEQEHGTVNVRSRRNNQVGEMKLEACIEMLTKYSLEKLLDEVIDPVVEKSAEAEKQEE